MNQGIEFLKSTNHPAFLDFKKNLDNNVCVTCGQVPLKECDLIYGMCHACQELDTLTSSEFDSLYFEILQKPK